MASIARVIDYETSGTPDEDHAEVVEMGRIDVDLTQAGLIKGSAWSSLCRPRRPIPAPAMAVHHITDADLEEAPEARDLWDEFFDGLTETDYLVAHNADFEKHFHVGNGQRWIDTYKVARIVWPDAPGHSNQCLRYWLDLPCTPCMAFPPHRALPDAYVTALLFLRLAREKSIDEMVTISQYPALLRVMNFGKHKGTTFEDAPIDYLEWIRDKSEMDEATKFSAKYWIQKRHAQ